MQLDFSVWMFLCIYFLADRTNGRAYATVLRLSVVCLSVVCLSVVVCNLMYCG